MNAVASVLISTAFGLSGARDRPQTNRVDLLWTKGGGSESVVPEIRTLKWIARPLEAGPAASALSRKTALTTAMAVALGDLGATSLIA